MKGSFLSKWQTWSRRSFLRQGGDILVAINGISCVHMRTVAVRCCGDRRAQESFVVDRDGVGVLPIAPNFWIAINALIAAKPKSRPA